MPRDGSGRPVGTVVTVACNGGTVDVVLPAPEIATEVLVRRHRAYAISTPTVRDMARAYFQCSTLAGLELENEEQDCEVPALGSHWEKRLVRRTRALRPRGSQDHNPMA